MHLYTCGSPISLFSTISRPVTVLHCAEKRDYFFFSSRTMRMPLPPTVDSGRTIRTTSSGLSKPAAASVTSWQDTQQRDAVFFSTAMMAVGAILDVELTDRTLVRPTQIRRASCSDRVNDAEDTTNRCGDLQACIVAFLHRIRYHHPCLAGCPREHSSRARPSLPVCW